MRRLSLVAVLGSVLIAAGAEAQQPGVERREDRGERRMQQGQRAERGERAARMDPRARRPIVVQRMRAHRAAMGPGAQRELVARRMHGQALSGGSERSFGGQGIAPHGRGPVAQPGFGGGQFRGRPGARVPGRGAGPMMRGQEGLPGMHGQGPEAHRRMHDQTHGKKEARGHGQHAQGAAPGRDGARIERREIRIERGGGTNQSDEGARRAPGQEGPARARPEGGRRPGRPIPPPAD
jgi:hypothetical protein